MKRYITLATAACMAAATMAQNVVDAARFGSTEINGTARYRSMAGAFGALGGDPSCMSDNPAGLGIYRGTSLFTFSPQLSFTGTETMGTEKNKESKNSFGVANFAWVASFRTPGCSDLVNFNIGLSMDRKLDTRSKFFSVMDGDQQKFSEGSFGQYLTNQANSYLAGTDNPYDAFNWNNQYTQAPFLSMMAWDIYAIDEDLNDSHRVIDPMSDSTPYQRLFSREDSRFDNFNISAAVNFNDCFYIGASLNIVDFNSTIETEFDEDYTYDYSGSYIAYDNRFETKGSGVGLNLGVLWAPIDNWRIGAAIHTPTWMTMREFYDGSMITDDSRVTDWSTFSDEWKYDFSTPWEYQLSTAYIIGNRGLISVEYDLRDFASMEYSCNKSFGLNDSYFNGANQAVSDYLVSQHTFKVGGEYRITSNISARAGYAYTSSPFEEKALNGTVKEADQNIVYYSTTKPNFQTMDDQYYLSCGAGWRGKVWYADLAYVFHHQAQKAAAYPGDFSTCVMSDIDVNKHNWDLTVGFRF